MDLTPMESKVVQLLRRQRVATMITLRDQLNISHMTVARACKKYGYFSSVNHNAAYYTLHDIPRFDQDGLWTYRDICFSRHRTLEKTLLALVHHAPAGLTVVELQERLPTHVGNVLSRLCRRKSLARCFAGHQAVYLDVDGPRQQQQRAARERCRPETSAPTVGKNDQTGASAFPPRGDVVLVLEVLIQIIKTPRAEAAAVAQSLRAAGQKITAVQVQRVFDFYALKKKRHTRRRGSGPAAGPGTER